MTSEKPLVFISCGQFTQKEKALGKGLKELIEGSGVFEGYFAENQSSLEGVTKNIFAKLNTCFGLVCVMHSRGEISNSQTEPSVRASVWIEQEIAFAAFLTQIFKKDIKTRVYMEKGIRREGVRDKVLVNPMEFETEDQVLADFQSIIGFWTEDPSLQKNAGVRHELRGLLEELHDNRKLLAKDLKNLRPCSEDAFLELKRSRLLDLLDGSVKEMIKKTYDDVADYNTCLQTLPSITDLTMARANYLHSELSPAKIKAAKSVGDAIGILESVMNPL